MATPVDAMAYAAAQSARVGWYVAQYLVSMRLSRGSMPRARVTRPTANTRDLLWELRRLLEEDWRNIRAGVYRLPRDLVPPPLDLLRDARAYFADLPAVNRRRRERDRSEVVERPPDAASGLPRYYLQNFHFQTDGYLSDRSARLYDHQVEVLFLGGADAMRRQALAPIHVYLRGRDPQRVRLLDLATGTGQFLTFVRHNHPAIDITALDYSRPYLREARRRLRRYGGPFHVLQGGAEAIPAADSSFDLVTCIFLFHELPRRVRREVADEVARVLKPGGRFIFLDSLQWGDRSDMDGLLEYFPQAFHEPYYADYVRDDLVALFAERGLQRISGGLAFLSKQLVFEKGAGEAAVFVG